MTSIIRTPEIDEAKRMLRSPRRADENASVSAARQAQPGEVSPQAGEAGHEHAAQAGQAKQAGHDAGYRAGYELGYQAGYKAGTESGMEAGDAQGRAAYSAGLRQLEELTHNLNRSVERSLEESEDTMVAIVFEAVCKIVGDTLASREGVAAVVGETLRHIRGRSSLIIRVNPADMELIEESADFGVASDTDWRADDAIPMGGCVVESEYGTLDARIDTQLNQLKRVLLAARHRPADSAGSQ